MRAYLPACLCVCVRACLRQPSSAPQRLSAQERGKSKDVLLRWLPPLALNGSCVTAYKVYVLDTYLSTSGTAAPSTSMHTIPGGNGADGSDAGSDKVELPGEDAAGESGGGWREGGGRPEATRARQVRGSACSKSAPRFRLRLGLRYAFEQSLQKALEEPQHPRKVER